MDTEALVDGIHLPFTDAQWKDSRERTRAQYYAYLLHTKGLTDGEITGMIADLYWDAVNLHTNKRQRDELMERADSGRDL